MILDRWLLISTALLLGVGFVMMVSASMPIATAYELPAMFFGYKQLLYIFIGIFAVFIVTHIPMIFLQKLTPVMLMMAFVGSVLVLIPGIGKEVNGAMRWLQVGPFAFQPSELAKLACIFYLSSYLVRHQEALSSSLSGFVNPLVILSLLVSLILIEPDFGSTVVIMVTGLSMLFIGGVRPKQFIAFISLMCLAVVGLVMASEYRLKRLTGFLDPWADQYGSGYQLTQSLIAFGRGGWFGEGLGESVQKLYYLPEPHTDFLFAVLAEELGIVGALAVLAFFVIWVFRAIEIGRCALERNDIFAGFVAYGISLWVGFQIFINVGVNIGILPTKGLTLPLMSYGGSSMVVALLLVGILFRIDFENKLKKEPNEE